MSKVTGVEAHTPLTPADRPDDSGRAPYDPASANNPNVLVYRITGAFFFGAAQAVGTVLDGTVGHGKTLVIDFDAVPFLDSTAANTIAGVAQKAKRHNAPLFITDASPTVRQALLKHGVRPPLAEYRGTIADAYAEANQLAPAVSPRPA